MVKPKPKRQWKKIDYFFEKLPPLIFIIVLIFLFIGGAILPDITAYAIILLNVYFLYKSGTLAVTFIISYLKIRQAEETNWKNKLDALEDKALAKKNLNDDLQNLKKLEFNEVNFAKLKENDAFINKFSVKLPKILQKLIFLRAKWKSIKYLEHEIDKLEKLEVYRDWKEIQHVIIIPHVKEPEHILKATLDKLAKQSFPKNQINIVLAAESRDKGGKELSEKLAKEYSSIFNNIWVSNHILGDDEIVGKSSNMRAGGLKAYQEIQKKGWDLKKVIVTSCDADSKLPKQYFSYVSYEYVTNKYSEYKFFSGAMVFYNNIWRLPFYARVKNSMNTLYNTSRLVRTDKLIPFSTYSVSFFIIKNIDFWTPWVTPEDYHLFLKAQFKMGGLVSTIPIYLRIMSDAAEGLSHVDTIKNNYNQERRWSWGISDDGWVIKNLIWGIGKYDFVTFYRAAHSVFDHIMTPILSILLIIGGNLPPLLNPAFNSKVLGAQLPKVSSAIITLSMIFMIMIIILDLGFKPKRNSKLGILSIPFQVAEWIVLPIASFILAVLPGLEANTRLLFGKYLEYYVTKKH